MNPVDVDGRSVVFVQRTRLAYQAVESGRLSYDGQSLLLENESGHRQITDSELAQFLLVTDANKIKPCHGFDLFVLLESN